MSVEAFAMAGMDYMENTINVGALEQSFKQLQPPQVMSETNQILIPEKGHCSSGLGLDNEMAMEWVKMKMREWAIAVASDNHTKADLRVSEILLIMDSHPFMHASN
ncbi:hypothetical protein LR48_Vigan03g307000 [Vigna angularis]|uniref:Uncharacterized protein n=1 Tax=Phaseolus angularis TaxID=3914 RepID=A0A0L9UAA2_PHAAN|nr:hypothetical protein LR48_Vigan03g307000 [Vigna angularis]